MTVAASLYAICPFLATMPCHLKSEGCRVLSSGEASAVRARLTFVEMATSESPHCSDGSPARCLNARAADFNPQSSRLSSASTSIHRTKSFYFEPNRGIPPAVLAPEFGFKRRVSSDCFPGANSTFQTPLQGNGNGSLASTGAFDPFVTTTAPLSAAAVSAVQANPYSAETTAALSGAAFFTGQTGFQQPVSHPLNSPVPHLTIPGPISSVRPDWPP